MRRSGNEALWHNAIGAMRCAANGAVSEV